MPDKSPSMELVLAKKKDLDTVLTLIQEFHEMEGIESKRTVLMNAVYPLLKKQNEFGCILVIQLDGETVGYIALCFGYSLEFGGRDAFIDELYIRKSHRGKKLSTAAIEHCKALAKPLAINALHLEVNAKADKLQALYKKNGFELRQKNKLMSCKL